jgi:hypothetical protein
MRWEKQITITIKLLELLFTKFHAYLRLLGAEST